MTVFKSLCAWLLLKISASRYPSRNLRVCGLFDKVGNCTFPESLETIRNMALSPASKVLAADLRITTPSILKSGPLVAGGLKLQKVLRVTHVSASRKFYKLIWICLGVGGLPETPAESKLQALVQL